MIKTCHSPEMAESWNRIAPIAILGILPATRSNVYMYFKNSLIIHEENTKKNHKRVVSLYVDKDFPSFT
jgi:hypothetical protein